MQAMSLFIWLRLNHIAANRHPALLSGGLNDFSATLSADWAFPAVVADVDR